MSYEYDPKTIKLRKHLDVINERGASVAILPGMLVELTAADTYQLQATDGGQYIGAVALEDELQGKTIEQTYAIGNPVQAWTAVRGEEAQLRLATGSTIVVGDKLTPAGDGTVRKLAVETEFLFAVAGEAITGSAAGALVSSIIA